MIRETRTYIPNQFIWSDALRVDTRIGFDKGAAAGGGGVMKARAPATKPVRTTRDQENFIIIVITKPVMRVEERMGK